MNQEGKQMTATEIVNCREGGTVLAATMLKPIIERSLAILLKRGLITAPQE